MSECGGSKAPKGHCGVKRRCDVGLATLNGVETDDLLPMNPEGAEADEAQGGCSLTNADIR